MSSNTITIIFITLSVSFASTAYAVEDTCSLLYQILAREPDLPNRPLLKEPGEAPAAHMRVGGHLVPLSLEEKNQLETIENYGIHLSNAYVDLTKSELIHRLANVRFKEGSALLGSEAVLRLPAQILEKFILAPHESPDLKSTAMEALISYLLYATDGYADRYRDHTYAMTHSARNVYESLYKGLGLPDSFRSIAWEELRLLNHLTGYSTDDPFMTTAEVQALGGVEIKGYREPSYNKQEWIPARHPEAIREKLKRYERVLYSGEVFRGQKQMVLESLATTRLPYKGNHGSHELSDFDRFLAEPLIILAKYARSNAPSARYDMTEREWLDHRALAINSMKKYFRRTPRPAFLRAVLADELEKIVMDPQIPLSVRKLAVIEDNNLEGLAVNPALESVYAVISLAH